MSRESLRGELVRAQSNHDLKREAAAREKGRVFLKQG